MPNCKKCGKEVLCDLKGGTVWEVPPAGQLILILHKCKGVGK